MILETTKKKRKKADVKKLLTRILVLILAVLMVGGSFFYVIIFLTQSRVSAFDYLYSIDKQIRVGLSYGSSVTVGFRVEAENGFSVGAVDSSNGFSQLWQVADRVVSVTCDCNLSNISRNISKNDVNPDIGGYHIQVSGASADIFDSASAFENHFAASGYNFIVFPAYISGSYCLRIGSFATYESASAAYLLIADYIGAAQIVSPSPSAVSVVNPDTNRICFEFDCDGTDLKMGLKAVQTEGGEKSYLVTPAGNPYDGVFEFSRNTGSSVDGVKLINIVPLDTYVEGVMPCEIGNAWPMEAQKAFAVAVRSYTVSKFGRHASQGFDVCNTGCCELYKGRTRVNENTVAAVAATSGLVSVINGKLAPTYYSSSTGGTTVGTNDAWGGSETVFPHLVATATPWERYEKYANGSWTISVTPSQLAKALNSSGYTEITGDIADVKINSLAKNSTYVNSITLTDVNGNSVTINRSDRIRIALAPYLYSSNFVVARAGETVTVTDYSLEGFDPDAMFSSINTGLTADVLINDDSGEKSDSERETPADTLPVVTSSYDNILACVMTASGMLPFVGGDVIVRTSRDYCAPDIPSDIKVITGSGTYSINLDSQASETDPPVTDPPETGGNDPEDTPGNLPDLASLETVVSYRTVTAEGDPGSFVFIGRGWGHGVGMSQWGIKDLADLGYDWQTIFTLYFPGVTFTEFYKLTSEK